MQDAWSEAVEQTLGRPIGEATGLHQRGHEAPENGSTGGSSSSRLCILLLIGPPVLCVCLAALLALGGV